MNNRGKSYPEQEARQEISKRSLGTKIAMVEAMRERLAPSKGFVSCENPKLQNVIMKCKTNKTELSLSMRAPGAIQIMKVRFFKMGQQPDASGPQGIRGRDWRERR